jgi:hypothetical protein
MKKLFLFWVLVVVAAAGLFAQLAESVYTSDGRSYLVGIQFLEKVKGQQAFDRGVSGLRAQGKTVNTGIKLTNGQWECVRTILAKYDTSRGDAFVISIQIDTRFEYYIWVCGGFTSDTHYNYWTFMSMNDL